MIDSLMKLKLLYRFMFNMPLKYFLQEQYHCAGFYHWDVCLLPAWVREYQQWQWLAVTLCLNAFMQPGSVCHKHTDHFSLLYNNTTIPGAVVCQQCPMPQLRSAGQFSPHQMEIKLLLPQPVEMLCWCCAAQAFGVPILILMRTIHCIYRDIYLSTTTISLLTPNFENRFFQLWNEPCSNVQENVLFSPLAILQGNSRRKVLSSTASYRLFLELRSGAAWHKTLPREGFLSSVVPTSHLPF